VSKTFYDGSNETRLFELNQKSFSIKQEGRLVSIYYNELVALFQEIDHRTTSQGETVEGVVQLHSIMHQLRVHIFLSGLDSEFEQVRGEILCKDPKLDLERTYACIKREFQQRKTIGNYRITSEHSVHSAMFTNQPRQGPTSRTMKNRNNSSTGKYTGLAYGHCGESGHLKQRCYEIICYPEWWDFSKKPRKKFVGKAMMTTAEAQTTAADKLSAADNLPPIVNVAHSNSTGKANTFSAITKDNNWIIDTGASDHMVRDTGQLQSLHSSTHSFISTANGNTSPTVREGTVILTKNLTLNSVLVVPSLEHNLLLVGQIASALNCTVTFWPLFCVFQDI
jgi:predicted aspartyl protease